jgi:hypothetical protein
MKDPVKAPYFTIEVDKVLGSTTQYEYDTILSYANDVEEKPMFYCEKLDMELGTVTVLVAEANAGKSALALLLSSLSGRGLPFLGSPIASGTSVYLHFDCSKRNLIHTRAKYDRHYAQEAAVVATDDPGKVIGYSDFDGSKLDTIAGIKKFEVVAKGLSERNGKLIIIDSLYSCISPDLDTNSAKSRNFIDTISKIAERYNLAVLLVHHMNKSGKSSGSQTIIDAAHTVIEMKRDGLNVELVIAKSRNGIDFGRNVLNYKLCKSIVGNDEHYWVEYDSTAVKADMEKKLSDYIEKLTTKESFSSIWSRLFGNDATRFRGSVGCIGYEQSILHKQKMDSLSSIDPPKGKFKSKK